MESDRGFTKARVDMVAGMLLLGADADAVTEVEAHNSSLRSGVRWYWVVG